MAGVATIFSGCAPLQSPSLHPALCDTLKAPSTVQLTLMFGLKRPDGSQITAEQWQAFVKQEITPRFPDGLTILSAAGQWRNPQTGDISKEPSQLVWVVSQQREDLAARIEAIRMAYKMQFKQQSVGVSVVPGCATF